MNFTKLPILRLDPHQRCAVMLVYDRHLAVLPFRRTEVLVSAETDPKHISVRNSLLWQQRATAPLLATFTTCLSTSTGEKINNVLDMQFLYGFYEPTLLVLYEPIGTWAGYVTNFENYFHPDAFQLEETHAALWHYLSTFKSGLIQLYGFKNLYHLTVVQSFLCLNR